MTVTQLNCTGRRGRKRGHNRGYKPLDRDYFPREHSTIGEEECNGRASRSSAEKGGVEACLRVAMARAKRMAEHSVTSRRWRCPGVGARARVWKRGKRVTVEFQANENVRNEEPGKTTWE
jgi:hypothetical protein